MKFEGFIKALKAKKTPPMLAVLVDPDKFNPALITLAGRSAVSCFLVGGSHLERGNLHQTIKQIKKLSALPVILFPGDENQLSPAADGLFLPFLASGRNADYLVEKQVLMAPKIKRMKLSCVPMAYILVSGKQTSTTQKVTGTKPLDSLKKVVDTAMAARYLGQEMIYLEAGSGAGKPVNTTVIKAVKKNVDLPLIVGGGINDTKKTMNAIRAGADMIVIGNALEKNPNLLIELSSCFKKS